MSKLPQHLKDQFELKLRNYVEPDGENGRGFGADIIMIDERFIEKLREANLKKATELRSEVDESRAFFADRSYLYTILPVTEISNQCSFVLNSTQTRFDCQPVFENSMNK